VSDNNEEQPAMHPLAWKFRNMLVMSKLRLPQHTCTTTSANPEPSWLTPKLRPTVATNEHRNGDQPEHDHDESRIMIKRVKVRVQEPQHSVQNPAGMPTSSKQECEKYWRERVAEWTTELRLTDEVQDDVLDQLEKLGWPEAAEISCQLN
jgi:hypothetical protein